MDHPPNPTEEAAESVNPRNQGLSTSGHFESFKSECNALVKLKEDLLRISQDMARVLDKLTAPKAPIGMVTRYGAKEFHRTSMEESNKAKYWLEKLQRVLEEVRCPPDQRVSCVISLL